MMHYYVVKSRFRRRWNVYVMLHGEGDHAWLASFSSEDSAVEWMCLREKVRRLKEYSRDIRRNSSGGDDYPWEIMRGVADVIDRILAPEGVMWT